MLKLTDTTIVKSILFARLGGFGREPGNVLAWFVLSIHSAAQLASNAGNAQAMRRQPASVKADHVIELKSKGRFLS